MSIQNIALFRAMTAKMGYLDHRQKVLAQNIANADTPGYEAHDLTKVDFGVMLKKITGEQLAVNPVTTQAGHMLPGGNVDDARDREQRVTYEVAPAGNGVSLEEQMINASQTTVDYNLMTTLYQKNVNMIRTALGRTQ